MSYEEQSDKLAGPIALLKQWVGRLVLLLIPHNCWRITGTLQSAVERLLRMPLRSSVDAASRLLEWAGSSRTWVHQITLYIYSSHLCPPVPPNVPLWCYPWWCWGRDGRPWRAASGKEDAEDCKALISPCFSTSLLVPHPACYIVPFTIIEKDSQAGVKGEKNLN